MTTNSETIEQQSTDSDNLGQLRHHEHQQPPPPVPNTRRRSSFNFSLPTPNLVGSIAEGAHYAGGLQSPHSAQSEVHSSSEHHVKHKRPEQLGSDDPAVEQVYRSVIADLHEVCIFKYDSLYPNEFDYNANVVDLLWTHHSGHPPPSLQTRRGVRRPPMSCQWL